MSHSDEVESLSLSINFSLRYVCFVVLRIYMCCRFDVDQLLLMLTGFVGFSEY